MSRRSAPSRPPQLASTRRARRAIATALLAGGLCGMAPTGASAAPTTTVTFADPAFRACVAGNLGMPPTTPVTTTQAASLTSLDCGELSPASLIGAETLTNLETLSISYGSTVADLAPLAGLTRLRELTLPYAKVTDLSPLRGLSGLTRLDVYGNPVAGLEPVSALINLTYLDVTGSTWTTLEPLRRLTKLRRLTADQEGQADISAVAALTTLEQLNLVVPDVRSLAPLRTLTSLTQLNVQAAATDVSALTPLRRLQKLSLNTAGGDGAALADKPDLVELSSYGVELPSLDVLASSTKLTFLVVVGGGTRDVSVLRHMTQLDEMILSGVDRPDFSPLSQLPQLGYLAVSDSRLGPLSQFNGFASLGSLQLDHDQLTSLDGFRVPADVTSLDISGNHLADISRLSCGVLVNALAQTVDAGRAAVGQASLLPLRSVAGQAVQLGRSTAWTTVGTSITYASAGSFQVPFVAGGPPECGEVQFSGVASQVVESPVVAPSGRPMRPPRDR